jgi:hypothetical protein
LKASDFAWHYNRVHDPEQWKTIPPPSATESRVWSEDIP